MFLQTILIPFDWIGVDKRRRECPEAGLRILLIGRGDAISYHARCLGTLPPRSLQRVPISLPSVLSQSQGQSARPLITSGVPDKLSAN